MSKLLNRAVLALRAFCAHRDAFQRYHGIESILIGPEKATATDGHVMAEVSLPGLESKDFPSVGNYTVADDFKPFLLPVEAATKVLRTLPKRHGIPVLECAAVLSGPNDKVGLVTTDLETTIPTIVPKPHGNFPDTASSWPTAEPIAEIRLSAVLVKRVCDYLATFGEPQNHAMCISIYSATAGEDGSFEPGKVKVEATLESGQTLRALIMPLTDRGKVGTT